MSKMSIKVWGGGARLGQASTPRAALDIILRNVRTYTERLSEREEMHGIAISWTIFLDDLEALSLTPWLNDKKECYLTGPDETSWGWDIE